MIWTSLILVELDFELIGSLSEGCGDGARLKGDLWPGKRVIFGIFPRRLMNLTDHGIRFKPYQQELGFQSARQGQFPGHSIGRISSNLLPIVTWYSDNLSIRIGSKGAESIDTTLLVRSMKDATAHMALRG